MTVATCVRHVRSRDFRAASAQVAANTGSNSRTSTNEVQNPAGAGATSQLPSNSNNSAGGTRLRRRLSNIFHQAKAVSVLAERLPDAPSTRGNSQPAICQSPRIQR